jgi:heptosyltransferase II
LLATIFSYNKDQTRFIMPFEIFKAPQTLPNEYNLLDIKQENWRDGVVVRSPNWLGDAVMALPAMYSLKKILPKNCGFFVVTPNNLTPLYSSIPWIDYVLPIGDGHSAWTKEQIITLKKLKAGVGMLFVNSLRSAYYFKRANVKNVYGASKGLRNLFLKKAFKVKWHKDSSYEDCHQSYKYLAMTYAMGAPKWNNIYPEFSIPTPEKIQNPILKNIHKLKNLLIIQPGAAYGPAKRWSPNSFGKVCNYWAKNNGDVVIVGAPKESATAKEVITSAGVNTNITNLTGKTSMLELMYVLKQAKLCLCNDSGVMHLASSLNMKGAAIFGSTDPYATGPIAGEWIVMLKKQNCSPCFSRECINKNYKCLRSITPSQVIEALTFLSKKNDKCIRIGR